LAALQKERGWTQNQLAQQLGVAVKTVIYYERSSPHPTSKTLEKIAEFSRFPRQSFWMKHWVKTPRKKPGHLHGSSN
jgi:transcriptional regulator with XRE-family HTH domain